MEVWIAWPIHKARYEREPKLSVILLWIVWAINLTRAMNSAIVAVAKGKPTTSTAKGLSKVKMRGDLEEMLNTAPCGSL